MSIRTSILTVMFLVLVTASSGQAAKRDETATKRAEQNCKRATLAHPETKKRRPGHLYTSKGPLRKAGLVINWVSYSGSVYVGYCVMSPDGRQVRKIVFDNFPNLTQP